ncbi:MAG: hypothetical protein ACR2IV_19970 [Bryobacteraceae bacterium]
MPDEKHRGDIPDEKNPDPIIESPPHSGENNPDHTVANTKKLTAELHWLEKLNITGQIILAIVGIWALIIYSGQLSVMRGTLAEVKTSGETTRQQIWSAIGNMNWMAKSMDESMKKLSEQASDTYALAASAKSQADNTRVLAEQTKIALHVTERAYIVAEAPELRSLRAR